MTGEVQCQRCRYDKRSTRKTASGWVCRDCQPEDERASESR
jgi:ribosomal protein L37AE/L43A